MSASHPFRVDALPGYGSRRREPPVADPASLRCSAGASALGIINAGLMGEFRESTRVGPSQSQGQSGLSGACACRRGKLEQLGWRSAAGAEGS